MSEIQLHPIPIIDVYVNPAAALDDRKKRFLKRELRAAWGDKGARWVSIGATHGIEPTVYLSCIDNADATAQTLRVRTGLAHLVASVKRRLPEWVVHFTARGNDGLLQLVWGLSLDANDVAVSLLGRVPAEQIHESQGRRFWDERDGGLSKLSLGVWTWNLNTHAWTRLSELTDASCEEKTCWTRSNRRT